MRPGPTDISHIDPAMSGRAIAVTRAAEARAVLLADNIRQVAAASGGGPEAWERAFDLVLGLTEDAR